ncbi:MAG: peptide chain release factor H [Desulfuromonadaceae bacterium]
MDNTTLWLQFSSGQGPAECEWVVGKLADIFRTEAQQCGCSCSLLDRVEGRNGAGEAEGWPRFRSLLLEVRGDAAEALTRRWRGTLLWQGQSPFRPKHRRKNWFISVTVIACPSRIELLDLENQVSITVCRAGGAGGQHVNKTSSAVRLTHHPTGLTVAVREERSQHRNKQIAFKRLAFLLDRANRLAEAGSNQDRRMQHYQLERGNPRRIFSGMRFETQ